MMMNSNDSDAESYLLLLLSDGNLPTGSFVASSGLESLFAHALATPSSSSTFHPSSHQLNGSKAHDPLLTITSSIRDSLSSYARSAIPFVRDTHRVVEDYASSSSSSPISPSTDDALDQALNTLLQLDTLYECTTLNHVARRASSTQGVALLTLYSKGFSVPSFLSVPPPPPPTDKHEPNANLSPNERRETKMIKLVDRLKFLVRRRDTPGHLPICWGVLAGALGLSIDRTSHLHLFLHARGLLSASIRMNALGPYAAQQLLLHAVRPLVECEVMRSAGLTTGVLVRGGRREEDGEGRGGCGVEREEGKEQERGKDVRGKGEEGDSEEKEEEEDVWMASERGPANTWPLGEIVAARHDLLHSRIFNS